MIIDPATQPWRDTPFDSGMFGCNAPSCRRRRHPGNPCRTTVPPYTAQEPCKRHRSPERASPVGTRPSPGARFSEHLQRPGTLSGTLATGWWRQRAQPFKTKQSRRPRGSQLDVAWGHPLPGRPCSSQTARVTAQRQTSPRDGDTPAGNLPLTVRSASEGPEQNPGNVRQAQTPQSNVRLGRSAADRQVHQGIVAHLRARCHDTAHPLPATADRPADSEPTLPHTGWPKPSLNRQERLSASA